MANGKLALMRTVQPGNGVYDIRNASRKIMLVVTGLNVGGAETQVSLLAKAFVREGHGVTVVSLIPPTHFVDDLRASGVAVYDLSMSRGRPNPVAVLRLAGLIRKIRPNVVHSHMVHANLLARVARVLSACVHFTRHEEFAAMEEDCVPGNR